MNVPARLTLVLISLLVPGTGLAYWLFGIPTSEKAFDPSGIPIQLGAYELRAEERLAQDVLEMLKPDLYVLRLYQQEDTGPLVWSYVGFYSGRGPARPHDPQLCYPAQGWDIVSRQDRDIRMEDGGVLEATQLRAYKEGREELVLYWFQPAGRWPARSWLEQLLHVYDNIRGATQLAFVRLSTPESPGARTEEVLTDFARAIGPKVRETLD